MESRNPYDYYDNAAGIPHTSYLITLFVNAPDKQSGEGCR
jgi:hypothetical protein